MIILKNVIKNSKLFNLHLNIRGYANQIAFENTKFYFYIQLSFEKIYLEIHYACNEGSGIIANGIASVHPGNLFSAIYMLLSFCFLFKNK